jgi:pyruvate ferredoxin oxidoreductase gamma subunit
MYRVRLHGRGGQGIKTGSRILGSAFFSEGYEVQDAPRYGAERRGAPMFAYVRAAREPIFERGVIRKPDLVVVADDTLVGVDAAGVLMGIESRTVLLIESTEAAAVWRKRLGLEATVLALPPRAPNHGEAGLLGAACAGAAARLVGVIAREALEQAIRSELEAMQRTTVDENLECALGAFDEFEQHASCVQEGAKLETVGSPSADWVDLPFEPSPISAPDIRAGVTSVEVKTGLWRTMRPVIDYEHCRRCTWVCSTLCPDGAILVDAEGAPQVDYDHCKGCLVCVAVCPSHAIGAIPEREAASEER